ncbi:MAG: CDP-archaeol synthase [Myxococcales bacterium]|nr:CDP-archaeol synthase [Myxococcales bacterium]
MNQLLRIAYLFLPLLAGLIVHGLCIKYSWLAFSARPLDHEKRLRGVRLFGANKTWRGILAVAAGSAGFLCLQTEVLHGIPGARGLELFDYASVNGVLLGFTLGAASMLAELPNSLLKRQLGVAPGSAVRGRWAVLFYVLDQVDMLLGAWLVLAFVMPVTLQGIALSVCFLFVVHQLFSVFGYLFGMRATPR